MISNTSSLCNFILQNWNTLQHFHRLVQYDNIGSFLLQHEILIATLMAFTAVSYLHWKIWIAKKKLTAQVDEERAHLADLQRQMHALEKNALVAAAEQKRLGKEKDEALAKVELMTAKETKAESVAEQLQMMLSETKRREQELEGQAKLRRDRSIAKDEKIRSLVTRIRELESDKKKIIQDRNRTIIETRAEYDRLEREHLQNVDIKGRRESIDVLCKAFRCACNNALINGKLSADQLVKLPNFRFTVHLWRWRGKRDEYDFITRSQAYTLEGLRGLACDEDLSNKQHGRAGLPFFSLLRRSQRAADGAVGMAGSCQSNLLGARKLGA